MTRIRFGRDEFETDFPAWTKHQPTAGANVRADYKSGKTVYNDDEQLVEVAERYKDEWRQQLIHVMNKETGKLEEVILQYLPLFNLDRPENQMLWSDKTYEMGASNTKQTTYMRLNFLVDEAMVALDYHYSSQGSGAPSFYDHAIDMNTIEEMLEDMVEAGTTVEANGIGEAEEEEPALGRVVHVVCIQKSGRVMSFDISTIELAQHLIGIEMYDFDQQILDDPEPFVNEDMHFES